MTLWILEARQWNGLTGTGRTNGGRGSQWISIDIEDHPKPFLWLQGKVSE